MDISTFLSHFQKVKKNSNGSFQALCPSHDDKIPSLTISTGRDGEILLFCHAGCQTEDILTSTGLKTRDLFPDSRPQNSIEACYDYEDETDKLIFQIVRRSGKQFSARRPDGAGGWIKGIEGIERVPYHLPELLASDNEHIFITEGEKDCDNLRKLGLTATTNPFGASKWKSEYNQHFKGRKIVILPDQDEEGRKHAETVANNLLPIAEEVKVVELPGLGEKQDVSDWIAKGNTKEDLLGLVGKGVLCTNPYNTPSTQTAEIKPLAIPVAEFMASGPDCIEWLVPDLIPQGGLVILAAKPKAGKSLLSTNLALAVAQSGHFLNRECKQTNGLILQLEDPPTLIRERLKKMGIAEGVFIRSGLLFTDEEWQALPQFITDNQIGLVVLDPLVFATGGGDENDAAKMSRFFLRLREIIFSTGATVLVVHHHRKSPGEQGDQIRGSSAILGAVDVALELMREDEINPTATLKVVSRLGVIEDEIIQLNAEILTWQSAGRAEDWQNAQRENEILKVLDEDGELTIRDLEEALSLSARNFRGPLKNLVDKGLVESVQANPKGRGRRCFTYKIASELTAQQNELTTTPSPLNNPHSNGKNRINGDNNNIGVEKIAVNSQSHQEKVKEILETFPGSEIIPDGEVPF